MSIKNVLKKATGLFVEFPESEPDFSTFAAEQAEAAAAKPVQPATPKQAPQVQAVSVKEIVERTEGPNLDQISITEEQTKDVMAPGGIPNFEMVYAKANLPKPSFGAEQALEVMQSLPANLPIEVRRATVQATLTAMGKAMNQSASVNTESVVADASRKIAALSAYEDQLSLQSKKHIATMEAEILAYQEKISSLNSQIAKTQEMLAAALAHCSAEGEKLDDVLEFFTLDIGASKNAPTS